ncbi:hypothetical protein JOF28_000700 [Leucobacter exalbidus]|uniref:Uncharacterized protein n=1 Tax=Leucobacter exalbidus TaxID=662960 RepID=A0A940PRJ5_9MICO|nr:hypothetical protein [Leucobacter exalbidus]MBP1325468.1 hypothetical protein [Leucobacter exalbidus]
MIGELFSMNATNFGRAAQRAMYLPVGSPVITELVTISGDTYTGLGLRVTGPGGYNRTIPIDDERVQACIHGKQEPQAFVDDLEAQLRQAVEEAGP